MSEPCRDRRSILRQAEELEASLGSAGLRSECSRGRPRRVPPASPEAAPCRCGSPGSEALRSHGDIAVLRRARRAHRDVTPPGDGGHVWCGLPGALSPPAPRRRPPRRRVRGQPHPRWPEAPGAPAATCGTRPKDACPGPTCRRTTWPASSPRREVACLPPLTSIDRSGSLDPEPARGGDRVGTIDLVTEIPGPRSRELLARKERVVADALSLHVPASSTGRGRGVHRRRREHAARLLRRARVPHRRATRIRRSSRPSGAQAARFSHTDFSVIPYESYVELAERLVRSCGGRPQGRPVQLRRRGGRERGEVRAGGHGPAGDPVLRGRVPRPDAAHDEPHQPPPSVQDRVRARSPPRSTALPYPYPYRADGPTSAGGRARGDRAGVHDRGRPGTVAAAVVEPIQGEGGFVVPAPEFLPGLAELCGEHGILTIADEIQTGAARTGRFLASEHFGFDPDIVVLGQGAGRRLSAVGGGRAGAEIMDAPGPSAIGGTYVGNPVACAAANAVLMVIEEEGLHGARGASARPSEPAGRRSPATCRRSATSAGSAPWSAWRSSPTGRRRRPPGAYLSALHAGDAAAGRRHGHLRHLPQRASPPRAAGHHRRGARGGARRAGRRGGGRQQGCREASAERRGDDRLASGHVPVRGPEVHGVGAGGRRWASGSSDRCSGSGPTSRGCVDARSREATVNTVVGARSL